MLRRGPRAPPRPGEAPRTADRSRSGPYEAGPDEHGGVRGEPGTVPRPRVRGACRRDAGPLQASWLADQGGAAGGPPRCRAAADPQAEEDGLSGAHRPVAPWPLLADRPGVRARAARAATGAVRAGRLATTRRAAPGGCGGARRPSVAPHESRNLAAGVPRRRRRPERDAGRSVNGLRIVWVKIGGLWPLHTGGRLRSFHNLSELSRPHPLTVLTTHRPGEDPAALAARLPYCERVVAFPHAAPKQASWRFVGSLSRSWLSALPVDLWKSRVPAVQAEGDRVLGGGHVDVCVAHLFL